jgi:hypothetical protein
MYVNTQNPVKTSIQDVSPLGQMVCPTGPWFGTKQEGAAVLARETTSFFERRTFIVLQFRVPHGTCKFECYTPWTFSAEFLHYMNVSEFVAKWRQVELTERSASQQHFLDLCEVFNHPKPAQSDPTGENFTFEKGAAKHGGRQGWADVWKKDSSAGSTRHFIVGNPPFPGDSKIWSELGRDYQQKLWSVYENRVPGFADLVCYWFEKARKQIGEGRAKRAGLLATQGIRGGANREVLKRIKQTSDIFFAESDLPWVLEGANVHISMIGFDDGSESDKRLDNSTHSATPGWASSTSSPRPLCQPYA